MLSAHLIRQIGLMKSNQKINNCNEKNWSCPTEHDEGQRVVIAVYANR